MDLTPTDFPGFSSPAPLATADELLAALPWGVVVLDAQDVIRRVNPQAAQWCGSSAEALLGQPLSQAPLPLGLGAALRQLREPGAAPLEVWLPPTQQWLYLRAAPAPAGQHWVFLENVTARHQAEEARQRSSQLLLDMEAVARTGSYEADLVSGSFYFSDGLYRLFGEAPQAFKVTLDVINARSHPADAAAVGQILDEAIRTRQPYTYRRRIRRADGEWRTLEAHGEAHCDAAGQPIRLRGLVQDITERVRAEQQQQASRELLQRTIDSSLDLVQVFEAVRDERGTVVDFTWVLNNEAAERMYGAVIGQRLCERNPGVVEEGIFDTFRQVLETGVPDQRERHYVHEQFDGWFYQSTVKLGDGVTTTTHDITARKQAEQELRETKELLQSTLDSSHYVVQVFKAVRDAQGTIIDFTWVLTNQAWLKQYGGPMTGKSLLHENPGVVETGLFELFVQVTETGEPVDHEQYYAHEQFKAWFHQTLVRMGDGFVMNTIDITERKQAQEEVIRLKDELAQQATDKYHALFRSMNQGFCVLEILFDAAGQQAVGFKVLEVNPQFAQESGMAAYAAGESASELVPTLDAPGLAAYGQVARTGEARRLERYKPEVNRWFDVHAFRIGPPAAHQVAVLFTDITARKQAEQQQQFVVRLADALRPLADPLAIQREALAVLRAHLGCARTLYAEALDQEGTMYISTEDRDPGLVPMEGLVMRFQDYTPNGLAEAKSGQPLWRNDVLNEALTPEQQAGYATFGTRAWLMVPLVKDGRLVADLTVHSATVRTWTAPEIALVQETTERTWAAVERARAEEALRASEEQFRAVANLVPDLLWRSSPDNETTWYSQRWYEYTGQTLEEAAGREWANVIHPDDQAESSRRYQATVAAGQPIRLEHRLRSAQGEYRWFQVRAQPLRNEHGEITAWFGAATDIHARKLAELRLRRDAEADAFRVRLNNALRPLTDAAEIQSEPARLLREWLAAGWCYYCEFDEAGTRATVLRDAVRPGLPSFVGVHDLSTAPEYTAYLRAGNVLNAPNIRVSNLFSQPVIERYVALGMHAALGVPLVKDEQLRAVLIVADTVPRTWPPEVIPLLQEVAERTWAAVEHARVEQALATSEENYRTLFDTMNEGFVLCAVVRDAAGQVVDLRYRALNRALEQQTGLDRQAIMGQLLSTILPPADWARWMPRYAAVGHSGEPASFEEYTTLLDRWYAVSVYPRSGDELAIFYRDITERKHQEQQQEFLLRLSDTLRAEPDAEAVANRALRLLSEQLGLDRCYIAEYRLEADHADIPHQVGNDRVPPLPAGGIRLSDFPEAFRVVFDRTLVIDDSAEGAGLSDMDRRNIGALGLRALVAATLRQGEYRPYWVLVAVSAAPRRWTPGQVALIEEVAERTLAAMEHARAEEALRESEEKFRTLFNSIDEGFALEELVYDANGEIEDIIFREVNWAYERQGGLTNVVGKSFREVLPNMEQHWKDVFTRVAQGGEPVRLTNYAQDVDRWFDTYITLLAGGNKYVAVVFNDITERKRREQEQAFLLELSDAFRAQPHAEAIGTLATRLVAEYLRVDRCYIAQFSRAQEVGWIGPEYRSAELPPLSGQYRFADFPEGIKRIETGPLIIRDLLHDPGLSATDKQSIGQLLGVQGLLAAVLREGERNYFWCLTVATTQPRDWTEADLKFLENVTERTWSAMERARTEQALAASEEKYRTLFETMDEGFALVEVVPNERGQVTDLVWREANSGMERHTGVGGWVGQRASEIMPSLEQGWLDALTGVYHTGEPVRMQAYIAALNRWIDTYYARIGSAGSPLLAAIFNDITERKRRELNTVLLDEIGKDLSILSAPDEIMQMVGRRLCEFLELSGCYFVDVDEPKKEVTVHHGWASGQVPSLMQTFKLEEYLSEDFLRAMHAGAVFVMRDTARDERAGAQSYARLQVGSFVTVPFSRNGRYTGHIAVTTEQAHDWQPQEIQLLQEISSRIFPRIERARAEEALRLSEEKYRTLFDTMDEGFALIEVVPNERGQVTDLVWREANSGVERHTGMGGWVGKRASEILPNLEQGWLDALTGVYHTGEPVRMEAYAADLDRWIDTYYARIGDAGSPLLAAVFNDITARKRQETHLALLAEISQDLVQLTSIDETLEVLGAKLGRHFRLSRCLFVEVDEAQNVCWVAHGWGREGAVDIPGRHRIADFISPEFQQASRAGETVVIDDVVTDSRTNEAEYLAFQIQAMVTVPLRRDGEWCFLMGFYDTRPRHWRVDELELMRELTMRIWTRIERARAEVALQLSEQRLQALIANLPGAAAFVVGPDLRYQLAGGEALGAAGFAPSDLLGRSIAEAMPPELVTRYEAHYREALAGQDFSLEHTAHGRSFISRGVPLLDATGQPEAVLVVSYDITARKQAEEALQVSETKYRTLFESMDQGFGIGQVLPADEAAGTPLDWQWLEVNPQFERLTGLPRAAVLSQTTRQLIPGLEEIWYERYAQAAAGETVNFESYSPVLNRWFDVYAFGLGAPDNRRVAVLFSNTSERKQVEAALREAEVRYREQLEQQVAKRTRQLQESRDLLQSVFDTSLISMSVLRAVRDEAGQVQDFRLTLVNKELIRETGRTDLVGKLYAQEYPGIRQVGIFDLMLRALATGEPQGTDYFYDYEGFDRWFTCQFVRLGDSLIATNLDITERKVAEQERLKNLRLLEQAEAVAGLGSWDYNMATGHMRWSDGMYHLFGLPVGSPVEPRHYLAAVVDDDRPRAEQLVHQLTAGENFEETLRLRVREQIKTVRMKAIVLRDETDQPARILGVDVDISELQRLEADNLRLRLTQQQALFEAVQAAQEAERRRMAESLHNGIGQILYATKLRLDLLRHPLLTPAPAQEAARQEADQLLGEAIRQTRALSHELVPMILEEFGLAAALQDIGQKMSTPQLQLRTHAVLDEEAASLTPMLQMALYRMAQELAQNIAKHAHAATEASLELETTPGWVLLRAEDNGPGFATQPVAAQGLGLRSIRDQVALLGGQVESGSRAAGGAYVRIRLPLPVAPT